MRAISKSGNLIANEWISGKGSELVSISPSDETVVWAGNHCNKDQVSLATAAARAALSGWWRLSFEQRAAYITKYASAVEARKDELARSISHEIGKPLWESKTEAAAVVGKAALSIQASHERRGDSSFAAGDAMAVTRYKPFGVFAVLGPFNFPAHLANGHIIPALLAGNTIVFKPSEQSPAVGAWMAERWMEAGLPSGVLNLVQGGRETGEALANDPQLDGLLFTGSSAAGRSLHQAFAKWPHKMLALEMGGNNPLIVHSVNDLRAAAYETILSAFLSAGQRCTCSRRLILTEASRPDELLGELKQMLRGVRGGVWTDNPEPFHGPVINWKQADRLLDQQTELLELGARSLVAMRRDDRCRALLYPGIVDVTSLSNRSEEEMFGPMLQVIRVGSLDDAIHEANNTRYGLSAGLLCDDRQCYEQFIHEIRAGVVNWNRQTTGASGKLSFGGCGLSGNNRPSGYFAIDYCNWPVASLEIEQLRMPEQPMPGIEC